MTEPEPPISSIRPSRESVAGRGIAPPSKFGRWVALLLGRWLSQGTIILQDNGVDVRLGASEPEVRVRVLDERTYSTLLARGSVGLGQSYVDGWWECEDLTQLVRVLLRNRGHVGVAQDRISSAVAAVTDPLRRMVRPNPAVDRRHVRAHYDLGNQLFSLMLDPTMSYSCAVFERSEMTLEQASLAKLERICRKLALSPGDRVLEIGGGWGSFALYAATHFGCNVTTTTISAEQYEYVSKLVAERGLAGRITVLDLDYRELRGHYDKLVSIEMIEAVDWRLVDAFFAQCARLLVPDGLMVLQAITIADRSFDRAKHHRDFVKTFIFPGGCLPSVASISASAAKTDMRIVDLEDIGYHYVETLRRWRDAVDKHRADIEELGYDERFFRMWRLYLSYCEAAFIERHVSDVQVVLAKPQWRPPLGVRS